MKCLLLTIPLLFFISPANAFWGLSEEEKNICRDRASRSLNKKLISSRIWTEIC
tara:strand:- start:95 stop:256 length:162 start_codon:yes stop_codon:yes gene_type:complete